MPSSPRNAGAASAQSYGLCNGYDANGKLHVERTGRRNRYHLDAPVEKVEAPLVLLVDNPRSDRSVTSEVTEVSPIEPDENAQ